MSNETKTPQADEWWVNSKGYIRYIIGLKRSGSIVWEDSTGWSFANDNSDWNDWHHEPRCTGFDWTEPPAIDPGEGWELLPVGTVLEEGDEYESGGDWNKTCYPGTKNIKGWTYRRRKPPSEVWPKYYVHQYEEFKWYIERLSETDAEIVRDNKRTKDKWTADESKFVEVGSWREVTEAEALARVKTAEPAAAESPDDWVELGPEHVLREEIDEVWYSVEHFWQKVGTSAGVMLVDSSYKYARCRRKDLPAKQSACTCPTLDGIQVTGSSCPIHGLPYCEFTATPQPKTMDVSPGEGWRWVEKDEPWQEGDDCLICDFTHPHTHNCQCWRRRIVPQPKRTPVRLFVSADVRWGDRYIVSVKDGNPNPERHQEIKFDGSRFYVEVLSDE